MKKLLTAAFAIVAALVALTETAGGYQHTANQRDQCEIAINVNPAANRQMATTPRPVNYEEPA